MSAVSEIQKSIGAGLPSVLQKTIDAALDPNVSAKDAFLDSAKDLASDILPIPMNEAIDALEGALPKELAGLVDHAQTKLNEKIGKEINKELGIPEAELDASLGLAILGGMTLVLVQNESAEYPTIVTQHPVQGQKNISDHNWMDVERFSIEGLFSAGKEGGTKHKDQYQQLKDLRDSGDPHQLIWDHPPGTLENVVIENVRYGRELPSKYAYTYVLDLVKVEVVELPQPEPGTDPATGTTVPSEGKDVGDQESGKGDGKGIGGFLKNMLNKAKDFANSELGKMARNALADIVQKSPIGGDLMANILKGDFSPAGIAESVLSLVPGGGILGDAASAAIKTLEDGDFSFGELAGNFAQEVSEGTILGDALNVLGGIPGLDDAASLLASGEFDTTALASAFAGGFVEDMGAQDGLLGDAAKVVGGWMKDAAYSK